MNIRSCGWNIRVLDQHNHPLISFCEYDKEKARDWITGLSRGYQAEWDYELESVLSTGLSLRLVHPDGHVRLLEVVRCN